MRIALRVPNTAVFAALEPYRTGAKGRVPFVYYGSIEVAEQINAAGATGGDNPAQTGVLVPCDDRAVPTLQASLPRFVAAHVTYVMMDCERGADQLWGQPDIVALAARVAPLVHGAGGGLRWQMGVQYGFLENGPNGAGGDRSVCTRRQDLSSCDVDSSYAGMAWRQYGPNDVMAVFGESGEQRTAADFDRANAPWVAYVRSRHPGNGWWAVSGLVDKDRNGQVDLAPAALSGIAQDAEGQGAQGLAIVWLGGSPAELFGPQTQMNQFLDLWAAHIAG